MTRTMSLGDYLYDGDGRRVKKISSTETTVFVYDGGGQLVAEYSTQTATTPQTSYLTTDHLGSPRVTTDQLGAVTARKDYSAFGEETLTSQRQSALGYAATSGDEQRKGYTGYEKDGESGLDFAQARYYNSTHGRYTSVDPLTASATIRNPQTFNRYSYVLNSPYKYTDPLGLLPVGWSDSTGYCGAENSTCDNQPNEWNYVEVSWEPEQEPTNEGVAANHEEGQQDRPETAAREQPPPPTAEQNADPQIEITSATLVTRTAKRGKNGDIITQNGQTVYEETVLAVGSNSQGAGPYDSQVNLNRAEGLLNIGETVYVKMNLSIVEGPDRATFDDNATSTIGTVPNIVSQKPAKDTTISSDGKSMTVYYGLKAGPDGVTRGKIGTITLRVQASYVDQYDSTTNRVAVPKTVSRDIRVSLTNSAPNPFFKKPY